MKPNNPFKKLSLDKEESEITQAVELGKAAHVADFQKEKKRYQRYAKHTLDKTRNMNIRLPQRVLYALKARAAAEGIPYQTLAASLLHQATSGKDSATV